MQRDVMQRVGTVMKRTLARAAELAAVAWRSGAAYYVLLRTAYCELIACVQCTCAQARGAGAVSAGSSRTAAENCTAL